MTSAKPRPRWWFLITPRWLAWHAFAVLAAWGMLWLGDWQFHRAEGGNALSWAYTFEWPIFAIFGAAFWVKTIRDELKPPAAPEPAGDLDLPAGAGPGAATGSGAAAADGLDDRAGEEENDPELAAYNAYLARLNEQVRGHGRWHGLR
jgi:hypothetical protein